MQDFSQTSLQNTDKQVVHICFGIIDNLVLLVRSEVFLCNIIATSVAHEET